MRDKLHAVFDHETFWTAFKDDLKRTQALLLIKSPFLGLRKIESLSPWFETLIAHGVSICVFAQEPVEWQQHKKSKVPQMRTIEGAIELLESFGVHVNLRRRMHEKIVVIDNLILWEGSLNVLSHFDTSERMTRWEDKRVVQEAIKKFDLDSCDHCLKQPEVWTAKPGQSPDLARLQLIGELLKEARVSAGLTQRRLAELSGIDQNIISDVERGKRNARMGTVSQLCDYLETALVPAPRYALRALTNRVFAGRRDREPSAGARPE